MKGLKRFVSVFAIAAMTVSLVGCGGGIVKAVMKRYFVLDNLIQKLD